MRSVCMLRILIGLVRCRSEWCPAIPLKEIEALRMRDTRFHPGLCHNDCWSNDFLDDGQRLWLLDWEFGGNGDTLYDVATVVLSGRATEAQQAEFLTEYGYTEPEDFAQLQAMIYVVWCFEGLWAMVQYGLRGSSDYDYFTHARRVFDRMQEHIEHQ